MDEGLKQRIIGAVVLIIAAVVFLPMLLSGQDETVQVEVDVPEAPVLAPQALEPVAPVPLPAPAEVPELPVSLPAASADSAPAAAPVAPVEAVQPAPAPEPVVAPAAPASAPAAAGDWVIQLGSFSSAANADGLSKELRTQGYNAYTHSVTVQGKTSTRVYVGPLASREAANRLRDELERKRGTKGFVVAYDADSGRG